MRHKNLLARLSTVGVLTLSPILGCDGTNGSDEALLGIGLMGLGAHRTSTGGTSRQMASAATAQQVGAGLVQYGSAKAGRSEVNVNVNHPSLDRADTYRQKTKTNLAQERFSRALEGGDIVFAHFVDCNGDGKIALDENADYVNFNDNGNYFSDSWGQIYVNWNKYQGRRIRLEILASDEEESEIIEEDMPLMDPEKGSGNRYLSSFRVDELKKQAREESLETGESTEFSVTLYVDDNKMPDAMRKMTIYWNLPFPKELVRR